MSGHRGRSGRPGRGKPGKRPAGKGRPGKRERQGLGPASASPGRDARDRPGARGRDRARDGRRSGDDNAPTRRGPRRRADDGRVCNVFSRRGLLIAEPFFAAGERVVLPAGSAQEDRLALVVPDPGSGRLQVAAQLGDPDVAADVIAALLIERDYAREHDPETLKAADAAVRAPDPAASQRRDLRDLTTFTIDPATAKDFDDAISAERLDDGAARIWVHIADVTSYLEPGGVVDRAGRARATSTYVPGLVAPMLPPQLADDACSLVPGADRRAVTVELDVEAGRCRRAEVYRSTIRSDERLTYEEVDEIFEGKRPAASLWAESLAVAREVAAALLAQRKQALELDIPEPEFSFDPATGAVIDQRQSEHTESHRLIEQLMVLANEQVARILEAAGAPGLFRIHEQPEASAVERLVDQLLSLGIPAPQLPEELTPQDAAEIVATCSRQVGSAVRRAGRGHLAIPLLILRALKVAAYSPANLGHAGLGLRHYCHFTSPIRRYPDIVCHRAVLALAEQGRAVIGDDTPRRGGANVDIDEDSPLAELARHCSDQERASMGVEREADRIAEAFLLQDRLRRGEHGQVFKGEVVGIMPAGLFINFGGGFDGLVPLRALQGDWWELTEEGTAIYGAESGAILRLGDRAEVSVDRVDVPRGRVDLVPHAIGGDL